MYASDMRSAPGKREEQRICNLVYIVSLCTCKVHHCVEHVELCGNRTSDCMNLRKFAQNEQETRTCVLRYGANIHIGQASLAPTDQCIAKCTGQQVTTVLCWQLTC